MQDQDLLNLFTSTSRFLTGRCEVKLCNLTPDGWGVTIIEAAVKFFYRNGTSDTDGPRAVNLSAGKCASFFSRSSDKCVSEVYLLLKVYAQGEPNPAVYEGRKQASDGQCVTFYEARFGPTGYVSEADLGSKDWSSAFTVAGTELGNA